jgi:hypothetical protein
MAFDWGSAIGGIASLGAAYLGSQGAKDAGKDASKTAAASNALRQYIYNDQRALQMPFYNAGVSGLNQYLAMLGLPQQAASAGAGLQGGAAGGQYYQLNQRGIPIANEQLYQTNDQYRNAWDSVLRQHQQQWRTGYHSGSDTNLINASIARLMGGNQQPTAPANPQAAQQAAFAQFRATPGYQFGLTEGMNAIQSGAAARGSLNSGKTLRALQRYGNDYADQQGYTPYMNRLASLFGGAQTAAGGIGGAGQDYASQVGQNNQNAANARAQSTYASNQMWMQGLQGAAGAFGDWYGNRYGGG